MRVASLVPNDGRRLVPGEDVPDGRGRTGLHHKGLGLDRNPRVRVRSVEVTSDGWHVLRRTTLDYQRRDGAWETQHRETYDRGDGAAILPYNTDSGTVLLTRQFRYPAYVNDHPDGMLIEVAAGLLDGQDPAAAIRREASEELGTELAEPTLVCTAYMSPGSVTEKLYCYAAPYTAGHRISAGGGVPGEEDIEVLELPFTDTLAMISDGRVADGKTILLLQWAALDGPFAGR